MRFSLEWERRFIALAEHVASWSKDPSTQVGAVIVEDSKKIVGLGYNGFPRGVHDSEARYENREEKYPRVVHAEMNAILNASGTVKGCSLFTWPLNTCDRCAAMVIQSGITTIYANHNIITRWKAEWVRAEEMYYEAGVEVRYLYGDDQ